MKSKNLKPLEVAGISCAVLLGLACICTVLTLNTFSSVGDFLLGPLRALFRRPPAEMSLYWALTNQHEASFALGEPCTFSNAQGSLVRSTEDSDDGGGFAGDMSSQEVIDFVQESLQDDVFRVSEGRLELEPSTPVSTSLLDNNAVYISFEEKSVTSEGSASRSIDGTVDANTLQGRYYFTQRFSTVTGGEGVAGDLTVLADFSCPLRWLEAAP